MAIDAQEEKQYERAEKKYEQAASLAQEDEEELRYVAIMVLGDSPRDMN